MISFFKKAFSKSPDSSITVEEFLLKIKNGEWQKQVERYRESKDKSIKSNLPAVTISGQFKSRDKNISVEKRIIKHSGFIAIDIDKKDNPRMSTRHTLDTECASQFTSCSGEGLKVIYRCKATKSLQEHYRIYEAIEKRFADKKIKIKVDAQVKNIASLQYVSYDPDPYINLDTKLVIQPVKEKKRKKSPAKKATLQIATEVKKLNELIDELGNKDITSSYESWSSIAFGLSYSLGEHGREIFHKLSQNYKGYSPTETDEKYDFHLIRNETTTVTHPITIATVYDLIAGSIGRNKLKKVQVSVGRENGAPSSIENELMGLVGHKLFMFKKLGKGEDKLVPFTINPVEFGKLLNAKGFFRHEKEFVHIKENIVERVDTHTILWVISEHIQAEGNYEFSHDGMNYKFKWEELLYLWKTIKGKSNTHFTIPSDLIFWTPNILKDTAKESYIPYQNGVIRVTAKKIELKDYHDVCGQVWKDRILPREFKKTTKVGMFEFFFANVCGRGKSPRNSPEFERALWYFGYMLHTYRDPSIGRAWMLYDIRVGNNGGTGKSIIGEALSHVRVVTTIDGKRLQNMDNRFWLQNVKPFTEIIFIDDPDRKFSLAPVFNMITGLTQVDRKGKDLLEIFAKFLFASNFIMESEGSSERRRQFITQVSDFYLDYAEKHNNVLTPIVHLHKKRFFTEWNEKDWSEFDSFCVKALQHYFSAPMPEDTIIGNSRQLRFIQDFGEDLSHDLTIAFKKNFSKVDQTIARDIIVGIIKDNSPTTNSQAAGRIARSFLFSINAGKVGITTKSLAGRIINVYKLSHPKLELMDEVNSLMPKKKRK